MPSGYAAAEVTIVALLLAYLFWVPLPFGSTIDSAQTALVIPPLLICALAALTRSFTLRRSRSGDPSRPALSVPRPLLLWSAGAVLFVLVVAFQLVPLPEPLLGALSPSSLALWKGAGRVAALAGTGAPSPAHTISIDPGLTAVHLFRILAYAATFFAAALLIRRHRYRVALSVVVGAGAVFEALYGVREAALHRYAIWGWTNKLMFNRVSGTFVNPNHFAHYAAIVLPLGVYLAAMAWHDAAPPGATLRRRIVRLVETRLIRFGCAIVIAFACVVAIVVAQSRGALVAAVAGFAIVGALVSGRRHMVARGLLVAVAAIAAAAVVAAYLHLPISRFEETSLADVGGRAMTVKAAFELWKRFPLFGSGLGTFVEISSMTAIGGPDILINHAHDDYAEIAATTGLAGLLVALLPLLAGCVALARQVTGPRAVELSWSRRAFQVAALTSLAIALVHALIDFNFFIPANPATLAAIAGAAAALTERR